MLTFLYTIGMIIGVAAITYGLCWVVQWAEENNLLG